MPKLSQYLAELHDTSLTKEEKLRIYQRFLDKTHRALLWTRITYYTRVTAFSLVTISVAAGAVYLFTPLSTPYQLHDHENGLMTFELGNGVVHAEPIGRIITAHGEMVITTPDGQEIIGNDLHSQDKVLLQSGAEIFLTVSDGFQAKIIGPAVFMLEDSGFEKDVHIYTINLLEGDYLEVAKIEEPSDDTVTEKKSLPKEKVIVKTEDFHVEPIHLVSKLDVVINTTIEGKKVVTNHGDDILVKKVIADSEKKIYAAVSEDQTVLVNGDIEYIEADIEKLVQKIEDQHLAIRYDLENDTRSSDMAAKQHADAEDLSEKPLVETGTNTAISLLHNLLDPDTGNKQVIDQEIMASISTTLSASAITSELDRITASYKTADHAAFNVAYASLAKRLQRLAQIMGVETASLTISPDQIGQGVIVANHLLTHLDKNYYITPGSLNALHTVIKVLTTLQGQKFGTEESVVLDDKKSDNKAEPELEDITDDAAMSVDDIPMSLDK